LADKDPDVRSWAAVGLSKVEDHFNEQLHEAGSLAESSPDPVPHLTRLSQLFCDLAACHPSDEGSQRFYLRQAQDAALRAISIDPERSELWLTVLRCQVANRDHKNAWETFERIRTDFPAEAEAYVLAMEVAVEQGRHDELKGLAESSRAAGADSPLLRWWREPHTVSEGTSQ
jgi:hypothetical protein